MEMEKSSSLESLAIELMIELPALCYLPCSLRAALALYECECASALSGAWCECESLAMAREKTTKARNAASNLSWT